MATPTSFNGGSAVSPPIVPSSLHPSLTNSSTSSSSQSPTIFSTTSTVRSNATSPDTQRARQRELLALLEQKSQRCHELQAILDSAEAKLRDRDAEIRKMQLSSYQAKYRSISPKILWMSSYFG